MPPSTESKVPLDLVLTTADGRQTTVSSFLDSAFAVVQLVRYFGCLPCQEWLIELDAAASRFAALGASVAAVGGSADYQAQWLRDERGVSMPLLLDPEHSFRTAVSADQNLGLRLLSPKGAAAYTKSLRHGFRPQKITRDTVKAPGVVVLDASGSVRWRYVGERIGDYPPVQTVHAAVSALAASD